MNVPNLPSDFQVVDPKTGIMTSSWQLFFKQFIINLNNAFGDSFGLVMPSQTASNIAALTKALNGTILYDTNNNVGKININGTFKTITTS